MRGRAAGSRGNLLFSLEYKYRITYGYIFLGRARLVHSWHLKAPTWTPPPIITCRREPAFLFLSYMCACMCPEHGTEGEPGAAADSSECWRVERGLKGALSPFPWLGVACLSRHKRSMVSWCHVRYNMYKSVRVVLFFKRTFKRYLFLRPRCVSPRELRSLSMFHTSL